MVQSHTEVSNQLKDEEYWECEDAQGRIIDFQNVQYSSEFKDPRVGTLESGKTIFHGLVESQSDSTVVVNKVLGFSSPDDSSHRRLATTGTRSVLLVRIKASDAETTPSESDLANKVFGVGSEDSFNLVSGYDQCAYGKLKLIPTDEVQNGVYTLELDMEVIGEKSTDIRSAAIEKLRTDMGVSNLNDKFDHVAFCLPPGTKSKYGKILLVTVFLSQLSNTSISDIQWFEFSLSSYCRSNTMVCFCYYQWIYNFVQRQLVHKH